MINPMLVKLLGQSATTLLKTPPFDGWKLTRSEENDPKRENWYEFKGHGVEAISDGSDVINTIFLHSGDGEALGGVPFATSRAGIGKLFGAPVATGSAVSIPRLGRRGPWDRFSVDRALIHVQFRVDLDEIDMITLMRPGTEPL